MDKRIPFVLLVALLVVGWLWWSREDVSVVTPMTPGANRSAAEPATSAVAETGESRSEVLAERAAAPGAAAGGAATNEADAEPTGELLVQVVWADGEKAPGVRVYLTRSMPGMSRPLAELVSDEAGQARAQVAAGKVLVTSDRTGLGGRVGLGEKELEVEVVAGQRQEVRIVLPAGVDVVGMVRDGSGAVVPGARIWLTSFQHAWCAGAFVGQADAGGAFRLRAVAKEQSLGAVAPGFAPSKLVDLDRLDVKETPIHVDLELGDLGGALAGTVVDANGKPVRGAIVAAGDAKDLIKMRTDRTIEERWAPRRAITDADGRYAIEGLATGKQPVEVWAGEFAIWRGECTIEAKATTQLDITLQRGVTVHGVVTGEDGKPLAAAIVRAIPIAIDEMFVPIGQYDYRGTFRYSFAVADMAGRYILQRASAGELHLYAGPGGPRKNDEALPWASEVVAAQPGAMIEWNPRIEPGPTICGVVRFVDGMPMAGETVILTEPGQRAMRYGRTDQQGRFRFVRLQRKAYDVAVQVDTPPKDAGPVGAREVWPDAGELELVAAFASPKKAAKGSVRGAVSDAGSRLATPEALVVALQTDEGQRHSPKLEGGAFRFDDVAPGRVRLVAMSREDPILFGAWFELQPAEDKDLGTLVTEPGGKLRLRIVRLPGTESLEPEVWIMPAGGPRARTVKIGKASEVVVDNLCAGDQRVTMWLTALASVDVPCTIVAGAEVSATIELRPAAVRELVVEYTVGQRLKHLSVHDERGGELFDIEGRHMLPRPFRWGLPLPLGRYTLIVETEDGGKAQVGFEMTSLAADQPPVVVQAK